MSTHRYYIKQGTVLRGGGYDRYAKRVFDIVLALVFTVPALCIMALCIVPLVAAGRTPFYRHLRVGRGGVAFYCFKIKTMTPMSAHQFNQHLRSCPAARRAWHIGRKLPQDPRVAGRYCQFLRDTHLDELPQILNIIWGQMSFVGPRPVSAAEVREHHLVITQRPGLTGLWQIERVPTQPWSERIALDARYAAQMSLGLDIILLWRTVCLVVRRLLSSLHAAVRGAHVSLSQAKAIRR